MTQLKADLDASLAEKGELQKEIFDKVEAHEKQLLLQKNIDSLQNNLDEILSQKNQLEHTLQSQKEDHEQLME